MIYAVGNGNTEKADRCGAVSWGHKHTNYFEGWYFKIVNATEDAVAACIVGVAMRDDGKEAFIQLLDGTACRSEYLSFPFADFWAHRDRFEIRLGDNYFSARSRYWLVGF